MHVPLVRRRPPVPVPLALALGLLLVALRGPGSPDPLAAGVAEAAALCRRARRLPRRGDRPWLPTRALRAALADPRVETRAHGELDALEDEVAWLGAVRGAEDLGDRSRGDLVFLVGVLHTYLALAAGGGPPACDHAVPARERVVFRDLEFADVLAAWD